MAPGAMTAIVGGDDMVVIVRVLVGAAVRVTREGGERDVATFNVKPRLRGRDPRRPNGGVVIVGKDLKETMTMTVPRPREILKLETQSVLKVITYLRSPDKHPPAPFMPTMRPSIEAFSKWKKNASQRASSG